MRRRLISIGVAVMLVLAAGAALRRPVHGFTLVVRAADLQGIVRHLADIDAVTVAERTVAMPLPSGALRARVYSPLHGARQTVLLVSGLHPSGIDEPRLIRLARRLSEAGVIVVTPAIPELSRFEITPVVTDRIEQAGVWLATASGLAPSGRIGLIGVSFSGGLALVAAGRPALRDRLIYVFSFGGHDDLPRVLNYLCNGIETDAVEAGPPPPHDYGVAVVLLNVAPRLVPSDQAAPLRAAVRQFLLASYLDVMDKPRAAAEFAAARELERTLPEPSATLLRYVNDRDVARLGPILRPYVDAYVQPPALSPDKSPMPSAPVYLLHGRSDRVIPSAESGQLAQRLRGHTTVHVLITDLVSHAEADRPAHIMDVVRLSLFFGHLLDE